MWWWKHPHWCCGVKVHLLVSRCHQCFEFHLMLFIVWSSYPQRDRGLKVKYTSICIVHFYANRLKCAQTWITHFTCKLHHACLYSPAAEHHRLLAGTHFTVPRRVEGWVDLGGWLHTEINCCLRYSNPDTVTHPSTNQAQRRLTSLI